MGSIAVPNVPPRFLIIGAGSRGNAYARGVTASTSGIISAVAEVDSFKRKELGRRYIWAEAEPQEGQSFSNWQDFITYETDRRARSVHNEHAITAVFICTLDDTHEPIIKALAPLNLHIMCEKPLALSMGSCLSISSALAPYPPKVVSIGHVLRYSPHNILLRDLLLTRQVIGEIVSIEHTEPIGWWHFSHSYVRGNWRRATSWGVGSLLTKSCHDIDFIMWLLCSPSKLTGTKPHLPSSITSTGAMTSFRKSKKPAKAGSATNCLNCAAEPDCIYSAKKIYRDKFLRERKHTGWPVHIVQPDIEDLISKQGWEKGEEALMQTLSQDYDSSKSDAAIASRGWYGRCVYESDNNVVDDQTVTMTWEEDPESGTIFGRGPKQALFHMTYPTGAQCERRGRIYGSTGEMSYDSHSISVYSFADGKTTVHDVPKQAADAEQSHGGGDWGLAAAFVKAITAVEKGEMSVAEAQRQYVGCDLDEIIRSHAIVFAAEDARHGKQVIDYSEWWFKAAENFKHI